MKSIKELEAELKAHKKSEESHVSCKHRVHYWALFSKIKALKDVLKLIDECAGKTLILKEELKSKIQGK